MRKLPNKINYAISFNFCRYLNTELYKLKEKLYTEFDCIADHVIRRVEQYIILEISEEV